MEDILVQILKKKAERVAARKRFLPLGDVERQARSMDAPARDFLETLRGPAPFGMHVIAEVKKASPSKGVIRADFNPREIAAAYFRGGASAISVLTEEDFFQGSDAYLRNTAATVPLPVLRKDFLVEPYQIFEAKLLGASAFLLIVACLDEALMADLISLGEELGMTPLVEVHVEKEVGSALRAGAKLIGINNRDLRTFNIDLNTTFRLRPLIPNDIPVIAESGIHTRDALLALQAKNVQAVLVGESLMREIDMEGKLRELLGRPRA